MGADFFLFLKSVTITEECLEVCVLVSHPLRHTYTSVYPCKQKRPLLHNTT